MIYAKEVAQAATATVKSIIAAIGGGGLFIILFLIIFIIGFLAASPFGMFLSDDNPKNGKPLAQVIVELDGELRTSASTGDELDNEGKTVASNWMDVLVVFAVKTTTTTTEKALDVGVMDDERIQKLREVLNDMNEVTTRRETETYTDEHGNEQTRTKTVTSVVGKTWQDMIPIYGFDRDQQAYKEPKKLY